MSPLIRESVRVFFVFEKGGRKLWRVGKRLQEADRHPLLWKSKMTELISQ